MNAQLRMQEDYFNWLRIQAFDNPNDRELLAGVLRLMHDVPFYWTIWLDENRAGDAMSFRQVDFLEFYPSELIAEMDPEWLRNWAHASPSVLEVLAGIARRWSFYFELPISHFFKVMFTNMQMHRYVGRTLSQGAQDQVRDILDTWMSRTFKSNGEGSPFPVRHALHVFDMTEMDIWSQMNAFSAEHFQ